MTRRGSLFRSTLTAVLAGLMVTGAPVYGQSQEQNPPPAPGPAPQAPVPAPAPAEAAPQRRIPAGPDYSKGKRVFPNFFSPYSPIQVPAPPLTNTPRIDQLIQEGKLMLSLDDAISLALENNLDISVERYVPWIAETDILRAKAGGAVRGLAGTGTAAVLGAIPSTNFDPVVSSTLSWARNAFPVNNPFISGVGLSRTASLINYNAQANFQYSQGFHTGTAFTAGLANTRSSTTSPAAFFNPAVQSQLFVSFQQQLLNGFGLLPNTRFIIEAKNNRKIADLSLALQVISTVTTVKNAYWELVFARENVKVQQAALATSQKLYEDNKRQVEIGTLAPIEVVRAESEMATDRQNLIVAQTNLLQQQTAMLNAITKNPMAPEVQNLEIIPTTVIPAAGPVEVLPLQDAVKEAWANRPELRQAQLNLKNAHVESRATRNALLPTLTLIGQYAGNGLGGDSRILSNTTPPVVLATIPGGLGDALDQAIHSDFPSYSVALNLTIPIRNRSAQADSARALLTERQLQTSYQQQQNSIVVDVRNALIVLQQGAGRVDAAQKARELAQQTLDAEEKKYKLGASTVFFVIQAQRDLTTAQGNEIRAKADLQEAMVTLDKALGRTLDANRITLADARSGYFQRDPLIPGTPSFEIGVAEQ